MKKHVCFALVLGMAAAAGAEPQRQAGRRSDEVRRPRAAASRLSSAEAVAKAEQDLNQFFRETARATAEALKDRQVRKLLKQEAGKKFDGDYDVLYQTLANRRVGRSGAFRQALGTAMARVHGEGRDQALERLDDYTARLPQLQLSVPANLEEWDEDAQIPLVAFRSGWMTGTSRRSRPSTRRAAW
jgi:hypothetical protein